MRSTRWMVALALVCAAPVMAQTVATPTAKQEKKDVKRETKAAQKDVKKADTPEHQAFAKATAAPKKWLADVKPTKAERTQIATIEKKYDDQITAIRKDYDKAEKAKTPTDPQTVSKVDGLVEQEKAEIRAVLTSAQQTKFDSNVAKVK
jgi:septal ring factor EnvC (AmiA/AmiB activator)